MTMSIPRRAIASSLLAVLAMLAGLAGCGQEESRERPAAAAAASAALTQDAVVPTGQTCAPSGAHAKHAFTACFTCHACGGVLQFDPAGPAVAPGQPLPAFDAATKTCSNVACHSVPTGTYSYTVYNDAGDPEVRSVPYGGGGAQTTPGWYTTGAACGSCHRMPASPYVWHSGLHGYAYQYATTNACETCHQDATGFTSTTGVVSGAAIVTTSTCGPQRNQPCPPFHGNGVVDVTPQWASACFGCH